jgi:uncharacterized membrane protein
METHGRSLIKSITFRIMASFVTIILVLTFTGNLVASFSVGSLEFVLKAIIYYFHERLWNTSQYGQKEG